jgi:hypothetical protein
LQYDFFPTLGARYKTKANEETPPPADDEAERLPDTGLALAAAGHPADEELASPVGVKGMRCSTPPVKSVKYKCLLPKKTI